MHKDRILFESFYDTLFQLSLGSDSYFLYDKSRVGHGLGDLKYSFSRRVFHDDEYGMIEIWFYNVSGEEVHYSKDWLKRPGGFPTPNGGPIDVPMKVKKRFRKKEQVFDIAEP